MKQISSKTKSNVSASSKKTRETLGVIKQTTIESSAEKEVAEVEVKVPAVNFQLEKITATFATIDTKEIERNERERLSEVVVDEN